MAPVIHALLAASARNSAFGQVSGPSSVHGSAPSFTPEPSAPQQLAPHSMHLFTQLLGQPGLAQLTSYQDVGSTGGPPPLPVGSMADQGAMGQAGNGSSYASRHQQAEARRRMRINERLESLREIVPHTDRANTATFLGRGLRLRPDAAAAHRRAGGPRPAGAGQGLQRPASGPPPAALEEPGRGPPGSNGAPGPSQAQHPLSGAPRPAQPAQGWLAGPAPLVLGVQEGVQNHQARPDHGAYYAAPEHARGSGYQLAPGAPPRGAPMGVQWRGPESNPESAGNGPASGAQGQPKLPGGAEALTAEQQARLLASMYQPLRPENFASELGALGAGTGLDAAKPDE
ncbi:hypothetical protein QBZ16_001698 [Prototheca wickerhamii]|uniref:BHLH domain-containing protein n=1 Tax=Prototheca wickerhamii TaxID=3111 RepID=A0AAD9IFB2_PROWI|nr:hypothetical protein QBZ16_001698 [Prototheca wickerhamii]